MADGSSHEHEREAEVRFTGNGLQDWFLNAVKGEEEPGFVNDFAQDDRGSSPM